MHVAHVVKGEKDNQKPFGSAFWHNGARASYFVKPSETRDVSSLQVALFNRKSTDGPLAPAVGYAITFESERTRFESIDVAQIEDLVKELPLWKRLKQSVGSEPQTLAALAEALDAKVKSVEKAVIRKPSLFTRIDGENGVSRIALLEREDI